MARIRSVHPSLFTDESWVSCSPLARILYIGLWTDADDQGIFEWKPLQIKMRLLPGDAAQAGGLLDELVGVDLIRCFGEGARQFGAIKDFRKYQRPQKPNAVHDLPEGLREYVGMDDDDDPTDGLRKRLCEAQDSQCFYCATEITHYSKRATSCDIDHRVPKAKGGSDDEENLVAACRACNRGKCDRSEDEWRAILVARAAKRPVANANTRIAPQMEDGGGSGEEKESSPIGECRPKADPLPVQEAFDEWNAIATRRRLPVAKALTPSRRKQIKARLADGGLAGWREALRAVEDSPLCLGENDRGWRADLDFVCQPKSFARLREGSYAAPGKSGQGPPSAEMTALRARHEALLAGIPHHAAAS